MKPFAIRAATLAALLGLSSAYADDATPAEGDAGDTLPTVIVTAEKSGKSLMDTATSAAVLDQRDLENRGLQSGKDVLANVPNIVYVGTGNIAPAIRGVDSSGASQGTDAFIAGSRPRINTQIDGRPLTFNEIIFGDNDLWDVEQVEVLRGAQSTLQGRNAMAGTIAIKSNDPTFDSEGALRVGGGNYDQRRASGMLSGPLGDSGIAYRLAADGSERSSANGGWESYPTVDDPGQFESLNLRGKLLFAPASIPAWRTLLTLNHTDYRGPQTENVAPPFGERQSSTPDMPVFEPKSSSAIVDTTYRISDFYTFEGLVTGSDIHVDRRANTGDGVATVDTRQYTVEPRLRFGDGSSRLSGVAGLFLYASDQQETLDYIAFQRYDDQIRTAAAFGEATIPFGASPFDLIVGARYEQEQHERHGGGSVDGFVVDVALDKTYDAFLPKLGFAWHVDPKTTVGIMASRGYNGGGAGANIGVDSSGGYVVTNYNYDPEHVWTYELYGRQELADGRVRLTANIFYSDYRDYQLTFDKTPDNQTDYSFVVDNADQVETYGAEAGATWLVMRGLEVYLNLGALQTEISKYPNSGYQGHELNNAPKLTGSAGVSWNGHGWDASFNARYADSYYTELSNLPSVRVDPYWLANTQLGYTYEQVRVYGSVRNVFDSDKPVAIYQSGNANLLAARSYWLGAELRW